MKKLVTRLVAASIALGTMSVATVARADNFRLELAGAYVDEIWGGEAAVTYKVNAARFYVAPSAGVFFYKGNNDRYDRQTFNNGNIVCRDLSNGQFADKERCSNTDFRPFARIEAGYSIPAGPDIGVGARFTTKGRKVTPYGTIGFSIFPKVLMKANAGPDYYNLGLTLDF